MRLEKTLKIVLYSFIYAFGFQLFLAQSELLATGFSGIAQIIVHLSPAKLGLTYSVVYFVLNVPGFILSYKTMGKSFTIYTFLTVFLMSFFTTLVAHITEGWYITDDIILQCVFGGLTMGYAVGAILKLGSSSGGTDIFGLYLLKTRNMSFTSVNMIMNAVIILFALEIFGLEAGLYTLLSLYVRNATIKFVFTNNDLVTLFIIARDSSLVEKLITMKLHRGTTTLNGYGGYSHAPKEVIMTTLNQYEYRLFVNMIEDLDEKIFINVVDTRNIIGNYNIQKNKA
ncbi:YitT family protein [Mollicutes bacterium LVI A0078]|nr:YitT family protein [Mollicutes bacterium LVI A0075]WOO91849.1 YitT family protein [Mollicutes bacterium LVI A0078]